MMMRTMPCVLWLYCCLFFQQGSLTSFSPIVNRHIFTPTSNRSLLHSSSFDDDKELRLERMAEIDAMGGDSSFFMDDDDDEEVEDEDDDNAIMPSASFMAATATTKSPVLERYATDGLGPTPSGDSQETVVEDKNWEWDGTVDENAHLDFE